VFILAARRSSTIARAFRSAASRLSWAWIALSIWLTSRTLVAGTAWSTKCYMNMRPLYQWGLSMALHEGSEFENGLPKDTNLNTYTPLRMGDVPNIEVELMLSDEAPVGLGEPATTVVAPAIGNAIFAATGARVRHLPIRPDAVRLALNTRN